MTNRADEFRLEALRRLSPERKLRVLFDIWEFGFHLRVAGVKLRFPELTEDEARRRAVVEMVECHKKNSWRKSPLFKSEEDGQG
ncbi:MAG: hypothetical protein V3W11_08770 [bacterium]